MIPYSLNLKFAIKNHLLFIIWRNIRIEKETARKIEIIILMILLV